MGKQKVARLLQIRTLPSVIVSPTTSALMHSTMARLQEIITVGFTKEEKVTANILMLGALHVSAS